MTSIVYHKDKRSGITYAYKSVSLWKKEKQQSRSKCHLIGHINENSNIIPIRKKAETVPESKAKPGTVMITMINRSFMEPHTFFTA